MELCSHIWEGGDYIPLVWDEWLADPDGLLGVAEMHGRVAGVFKLTKFQEGEWYMEGLRVHPDFQGKGVASHIHELCIGNLAPNGERDHPPDDGIVQRQSAPDVRAERVQTYRRVHPLSCTKFGRRNGELYQAGDSGG